MTTRAGQRPNSSRFPAKWRIGIALVLLILVIGLVVYATRDDSAIHKDPNIGKSTDVVIEGSVSLNGQLLAGGYVIAWQGGPPVAYCDVRGDGSYSLINAPLGKCLITYSASPPRSIAPRHNIQQAAPGANMPDAKGGPGGKGKNKEKEPKQKGEGKEKEPGGKDKEGGGKEMGSPLDGLPFGRESPVGIQNLSPEQRKMVASAAAKYKDPSKSFFQLETKKGTNTFNLSLSTP